MGQVREVEVFRYIAEDTIEEKILELQAQKGALAGAAFSRGGQKDMKRVQEDDSRLLMGL